MQSSAALLKAEIFQNASRGRVGCIVFGQMLYVGGIVRQRASRSHKLDGKLKDALLDRLITLQSLPIIEYNNIFNVYLIRQLDLSEQARC